MINVCGKSLNIKGIKFVGSVYYNDFCMKDNKEVVFMDVDQYQLILDNAQVGWWKADFEERCICSGLFD